MIILDGVSKWYHGDSRVLEDVSIELNRGEFLYLVGGSGTGKTSLLRLLATEEFPSQGKVSLFGYDVTRMHSSTLRRIRQSVGYVPQDIRLIPDLSVLDNVMLSVRLSQSKVRKEVGTADVHQLLEKLGLFRKAHVEARFLSGGEAQRVAVARALIRKPEIILADEPSGAQDREYTWSMMDLFVKANLQGATVVVATHDREIVRRIRKKCATLRGGRVLYGEDSCIY